MEMLEPSVARQIAQAANAFQKEQTGHGAFQERAERVQAEYRDRGLTLETTGPWPPFNFCPCWEGASP